MNIHDLINDARQELTKMAKSDRGFASMDPEKQRAIASKGGVAAHAQKRAHKWTREEAAEAGRKGGIEAHRRKREAETHKGGTE